MLLKFSLFLSDYLLFQEVVNVIPHTWNLPLNNGDYGNHIGRVEKVKNIASLFFLFNSNSSSFTSNLCGFPNGVFIRNRLTRRDSSPQTRTFTSKRVFYGEKYVCVDGQLSENHRQKLGLVC